jgi:hypothetical protein
VTLPYYRPDHLAEIKGMNFPARCTCGQIFDLGAAKVLQRYTDCSVFELPCCKRTTDDRPAGWRSGPNYYRINKLTGQEED